MGRYRTAISKTVATGIIVVILLAVVAGAWLLTQQAPPEETTTPTPTETTPTTTPTATTPTKTETTPTATPTSPAKKKIAVVYDIGGRGDLSFNDMAYMGAKRAAEDFGLEVVEVQSRTQDDYLPNLRSLAQKGEYLVIIAVGFLMTDAVKQVADEYPDQYFAIIDGYIPDKPNVLSVLFRENEGSALVGALAGLIAAHYGEDTVGIVLGMEIPVLWKFEIGYKWGVKWAEQYYKEKFGKDVSLKVLWTYTGVFNDPAKGKTAAEAQLGQGAIVIYQAAGATGLGVFEAVEAKAKELGRDMGPPFAIGVDADQDYIKPGFIIASMMKRVDVGVYTAVKLAYEGKFKGGILELGVKEGGIAVSKLEDLEEFLELGIQAGTVKLEEKAKIIEKVKAIRESIPSWIWDAVKELEKKIVNGEVEVPAPATEDEIKYWRDQLG